MKKFLKEHGFFIVSTIFFIGMIGAAIRKNIIAISKPPQIIGQGEVASVEYLQGSWSSSDQTIIRFKDGSATILFGMQSIPAGKITVLCGPDGYKIKRGIE